MYEDMCGYAYNICVSSYNSWFMKQWFYTKQYQRTARVLCGKYLRCCFTRNADYLGEIQFPWNNSDVKSRSAVNICSGTKWDKTGRRSFVVRQLCGGTLINATQGWAPATIDDIARYFHNDKEYSLALSNKKIRCHKYQSELLPNLLLRDIIKHLINSRNTQVKLWNKMQ
jgi:hypothetical protein